jgi:hypothetical protein
VTAPSTVQLLYAPSVDPGLITDDRHIMSFSSMVAVPKIDGRTRTLVVQFNVEDADREMVMKLMDMVGYTVTLTLHGHNAAQMAAGVNDATAPSPTRVGAVLDRVKKQRDGRAYLRSLDDSLCDGPHEL